jgi:hypothetical protein
VSYDIAKIRLIFDTYKGILPILPMKIAFNPLKFFAIVYRSPSVIKRGYWLAFEGVRFAIKVYGGVFVTVWNIGLS